MNENIDKFIDTFAASVAGETFIKLTLGNYKGPDEHLQKIHARPIDTKKGTRLYFLYRSDTSDTAKNLTAPEAVEQLRRSLGKEFFSAHLFTSENDFQLEVGKRNSRLNEAKPTLKKPSSLSHDREKHRWVDQDSFYLKALGITNDHRKIRDRSQDKWRQINKFVEILAGLIDKSPLADSKDLSIVDMGSGKGYLTFAAYDYLRNVKDIDVKVTGVEARAELVEKCNEIARTSEFTGLAFVKGNIA